MVDCQQNHGFNELSLHNRAFNSDDRFTGENRSSLGNAVYIALKFKILEIVEKFLAEASASEIFNVFI